MDMVLSGIHGIMGKIKALEKSAFAKDMMSEIALLVMARIKERTLRGEDIDGDDFVDYSPAYKEWKKKKGYSVSPVDLTFSGHMLSAMTETSTKTEAKIFFMDTKDTNDVSAPDKAFWNNEDREFFGLSKSDKELIMKTVVDYYEKLTGRLTLK